MVSIEEINGIKLSSLNICQIILRNVLYEMFEDPECLYYYPIFSHYNLSKGEEEDGVKIKDTDGNEIIIDETELEKIILCNVGLICNDIRKAITGTEGKMILTSELEFDELTNLSLKTKNLIDKLEPTI
tara:strand:+ start:648 stop:1034 length:387 start_codon:yes stop_codon:yes gene_type:complete